jgi:hypothetical protein
MHKSRTPYLEYLTRSTVTFATRHLVFGRKARKRANLTPMMCDINLFSTSSEDPKLLQLAGYASGIWMEGCRRQNDFPPG